MDAKTSTAPTSQPFLGAFDLFKPSIKAIILNLKTFLLLALVPCLFFVGALPLGALADAVNIELLGMILYITATLGALTGFALLIMAAPGVYLTQVKSARGEIIEPLIAFKQGLKFFWRFYAVSILQSIILILGLLALVVPFFYMLRRYILVQFYVVDRNASVGEAFRLSAADSQTYRSPLWGLVGVTALINILAMIPLLSFVMWIPAMLYSLAPAIRYNEVKTASAAAGRDAAKVTAAR